MTKIKYSRLEIGHGFQEQINDVIEDEILSIIGYFYKYTLVHKGYAVLIKKPSYVNENKSIYKGLIYN